MGVVDRVGVPVLAGGAGDGTPVRPTAPQLVRQYPTSFEFTGHYLERLVEGLYSASFINFAGQVDAAAWHGASFERSCC